MAEKQSTKERLKEITAQIETGIREIFQSGNFEQYQNYLRTMSKFHRYSVNNQMLIHLQRPDATLVAGFNKWKNQFDRYVKKGEKGIVIIAPIVLIFAFLISPFGLPMLAAWLLGKLQDLRYAIQDWLY